MTLQEALAALAPGAAWALRGESIDDLVWHDEKIPRPTDAAVAAKMAEALPRTISQKSWNDALDAAGKLDAWIGLLADKSIKGKDRAYLMSGGANGDYLEGNPKLARLSSRAGFDVKQLFDAILAG